MIDTKNIILATDSYKLNHWNQYTKDTDGVYSYFESRVGSEYPYGVLFGLQYILKEFLEGVRVTQENIDAAAELSLAHFGSDSYFNKAGWKHILEAHGGKLPVRIKAVPEGMPIPTNNVLMTVENTDPEVPWLTNAIESLLTHVWYSSNVATLSRITKEMISGFLAETADSQDGLMFMLHDFGYRGATSHESAGIGGLGHLLNFLGTDTLPAMLYAMKYYDAPLEGLAYSVAATEHSIMTSLGPDGEFEIVDQLLEDYPTGILSVVADSYDIYNFVSEIGARRDKIVARDGVFVVRPDSITNQHKTPEALTTCIMRMLESHFGATTNSKGFRVLDPHVRVLWGDGIDRAGIEKILAELKANGYSAENMVFGMGGGLLQKHNRDTQRFAFKCSAQHRGGTWHDVWKKPLDLSKASKHGRLALIEYEGKLLTTCYPPAGAKDYLEVVFENGELKNPTTFAEARERAQLPALAMV
jgi:nicotinamide phosphoribosyltransferase